MKTQISRVSDRPGRRYSGVYQQQGRMITDADWNELVEILKRRLDDALAGVVGSGMPQGRGLAIAERDGVPVIVPGEVVVDGVAARFPGDPAAPVAFTAQPDFPGAPPLPAGIDARLYADVWERSVDAIEDDALRDPGLHGADTTTRTRTMVQLKWCPITVDPQDAAANPGIGDARVRLRLPDAGASLTDADGCISADGSSTRVGNSLFRVEVHDAVALSDGQLRLTLKWSGENGAEQCSVVATEGGAADLSLVPEAFLAGPWVWELCDAASESQLGLHHANNLTVRRGELLDDTPTQPDLDRAKPQRLRRWDGCCSFRLSRQGVVDKVVGRDRGQPLGADLAGHGRVETFTSTDGVRALRLTLVQLVFEIELGNRRFVPGDHWLAVVRENAAEDQRVSVLNDGAPLGVRHHALTLGEWRGGHLVVPPQGSALDRQRAFPPLSALIADRIGYDPAATRERWLDIAEAPAFEPRWGQRIGGAGLNAARAVAADAAGQVYVTGSFEGALSVGGLAVPGLGEASRGVFLAKLAPGGAALWVKALRAGADSHGNALAVIGPDGVVLAGSFVDSIELGAGTTLAATGRSAFMARFGADGSLRWSRSFGDTGTDIAYAVAHDAKARRVVLTGCFAQRIRFDATELAGAGGLDIFVAAFAADTGVHAWSRRLGAAGYDVGHAVACDGAGRSVVSGFFQGILEVGNGHHALESQGKSDVFVLQLDPHGATRWARGFGGSASDQGRAVALGPDGAVYLAGHFHDRIAFGGAGSSLVCAGGADIYLARLDADGVHRWSKSFPATQAQQGLALAVDAAQRVFLAGAFSGSVNFGGATLPSVRAYDAFVACFDGASGAHRHSRALGSGGLELARGVAALPAGVVLAGSFELPIAAGAVSLAPQGGRDAFVLALASSDAGPITVQQALDQLAGDLEASDIGYPLPGCTLPGGGTPTLGRLLGERSGWAGPQRLTLDAVLDALLCRLDAGTLPTTQGGRPTTVQDSLAALWAQKVAKAGDRMSGALVIAGGGLAVGDVAAPGDDNLVVKGRCTVQGDLVVRGATTTLSTTQLLVEDNIVELNRYDGGAANILDAGLQVYRGSGQPAARLLWDEDTERWLIGSGEKTALAPVATGEAQDVVTGVVVFRNPSRGVLVESPKISPFGAQLQGALIAVQLGLVEDDAQRLVSQLDPALRPVAYGARIEGATGRFSIVLRRVEAGSGDVLVRWWAQMPRRQEHARESADIEVQIDPVSVAAQIGDSIVFRASAHGAADLPGQDMDAVAWRTSARLATEQPHQCTVIASMPGAFIVRAESRADPTRYAEARVTAAPVHITVSAPPADLHVGQQHAFTATVTGTTHTAVQWSASRGAIDFNTGVYTATSGGAVVVTAALKAATSETGQVGFQVAMPPPVSVRLSPHVVPLLVNQSRPLTVTVSNAQNKSVHWSCTKAGRILGMTDTGCIVRGGPTFEQFSVTATSVEDPTASDTAEVIVETGQ